MYIVALIAAVASLLTALLLFRRCPESPANADASVELATLPEQLRGRDAQLEELRSALGAEREQHRAEQARVVQLSTDLARARAGAERGVALEEQLRAEVLKAEAATSELRRRGSRRASSRRREARLRARPQLRRSARTGEGAHLREDPAAAKLEAAGVGCVATSSKELSCPAIWAVRKTSESDRRV
jgi:hypothetical protein